MPPKNRRNYYRVLQVQPDASLAIIKASYRTLMRTLKYHPDLGGDQWNAVVLNEAYAVLSDAHARDKYDGEQRELHRRVGSTARAAQDQPGDETHRASSRPAPTATPATPRRHGSSQWQNTVPTDARVCAFCHARKASPPHSVDELCDGCGAPRWRIDSPAHQSSRHGTGRIEHRADIHYLTDPRHAVATRGRVVDLSPTGLRFVSRERLSVGEIIKIDSDTVSAIARVSHTRADDATDSFSIGAQFLTLLIELPRGTFVSERA